MKKLLYCLLAFMPLMNLQAQDFEEEITEYTLEGTVTAISRDSILTIQVTIESEVAPPAKQNVGVTKKFAMGNMKGTMGVADGQVISYSNGIVKVQVLKYTSSMVQDGKRIPLIKVENTAVLTWKMRPIPTYASEYKKARKMMTAEKYDLAEVLLDSLVKADKDIDALYSRGYCRFKQSKYDACITDMNEVIVLKADHEMAYFIRALSYARQEKYEQAIPDLEFLLTREMDAASEIHILKEHIYMVNKLRKDDRDVKLCKDYTRLCQLDSDDMNFYSEKNRLCNNYPIEKFPSSYLPVYATYQSIDNFTVAMKMLKKGKYKWYEKSHTLNKKITVGSYVKLQEISEGMSMDIAVAKVTKVDGDMIELKIMYWSNRMNDEPIIYEMEDNKSDWVICW